MKYLYSTLTFLLLAIGVKAQFVINFDNINSSPNCYANYNYSIYSEIIINKVKIVDIYYDDGVTGSFKYEIYFDVNNVIFSDRELPSGDYWAFDVTLYADKHNKSLKNNLRLPIKSGVFNNLKLDNNPTFIGSAKAMGFELGKEYTASEILSIFAYERASLYINLPCLETTVNSAIRPVIAGNVPLPVTLQSFQVTTDQQQHLLKWTTSNESNLEAYIIEQRTDDNDWEPIGKIAPQSHIASAPAYDYQWVNANINSGKYFYRIKMVDIDGHYSYSTVRMVQTEVKHNISLSPNPAHNVIHINGVAIDTRYTIYNAIGNVVKMDMIDATNKINIEALNEGMYTIKFEGNQQPYRFIKQ